MIRIKEVIKDFGSFRAVDRVSLDVMEGEIFAFLGVNGAGKTTTIRMLTGILEPTSGSIQVGPFLMESEPEKAKAITGYIPDRPHLYSKLTGREFLYFVSDLYSVRPKEADSRIDELLHEYQMEEWQGELIENYSHGMKQRLATCAALVHRPAVLVVDEPMVGLDPHGARLLKSRFKYYASQGMVIFLSTHLLSVAEELADRMAIIDRGKIITIGTLAEIRERTGILDKNLEEIFIAITSQSAQES